MDLLGFVGRWLLSLLLLKVSSPMHPTEAIKEVVAYENEVGRRGVCRGGRKVIFSKNLQISGSLLGPCALHNTKRASTSPRFCTVSSRSCISWSKSPWHLTKQNPLIIFVAGQIVAMVLCLCAREIFHQLLHEQEPEGQIEAGAIALSCLSPDNYCGELVLQHHTCSRRTYVKMLHIHSFCIQALYIASSNSLTTHSSVVITFHRSDLNLRIQWSHVQVSHIEASHIQSSRMPLAHIQ